MNNKKQVFYIRVSTAEQNPARQHKDLPDDAIVLVDICSGSTPLFERPEGSKIRAMIEREEIYQISIHQLDRLGRDTLDVLTTIKYLMSKGVNLISANEGINTIVNGKENPLAKMLIGVLATFAEMEQNRRKERQAEGIAKAKERGVYIGGSAKAKRTPETTAQFLAKPKTKKVVRVLKEGNSLRRTALICGVSLVFVQKVRNALESALKVADQQS
jgi:DNA invertase Pin-like site-specific DNA recombinase